MYFKRFISRYFVILPVFLSFMLIYTSGCSDSSTSPTPTPTTLSFTITAAQTPVGGTKFLFTPTVNVKVSNIEVKQGSSIDQNIVPTQGSSYVFSSDTSYPIGIFNTSSHEIWSFGFTGTNVSSGAAYTNILAYDTIR